MYDGWLNDDFWTIFENDEPMQYSKMYDIAKYLPGYEIIGLKGWDNFIVKYSGRTFTVPTVPIHGKYVAEIALPVLNKLEKDARFTGKIKWYTTPLIVGGSPTDKANMSFIDIGQHIELVKWWNDQLFGKIA